MANKVGAGTDIPTEMFIRVIGRTMSSRERGPCGIPTKISMRANGIKERKTAGGSIFITMEPYMRETLPMEEKTVTGLLPLPTEQGLRRIGSRHMYKGRERFSILMGTFSKANITCPKNMGKASTCGVVTTQSTKGSSKRTLCKGRHESILPTDNTTSAGLEMEREMARGTMTMKTGTLSMGSGKTI